MILHAPLDQVLPITLARYSYSSIPALYTLLDSTNMEQSGILPVMRQPGLNTGGEGVLLGIIDTGIDYRNPLFRNTDGTTRILGIWDQTATGSFSMESSRGASYEFLYGKEYRKEQIDEALASTLQGLPLVELRKMRILPGLRLPVPLASSNSIRPSSICGTITRFRHPPPLTSLMIS